MTPGSAVGSTVYSATAEDRPARRSPLVEYFILSMLLHILLVLLFGNPAGDGSSRGQKLLGAFNVTLNPGLREWLSNTVTEPTTQSSPASTATSIKQETARTDAVPDADNAPVTYTVPTEVKPDVPEATPPPITEPTPEAALIQRTPINEAAPSVTHEISKPVTKFVVPLPVLPAPAETAPTVKLTPERAATPSVDSRLQEKTTVLPPHPELLFSPKTERFTVPPPTPAKPDEAPVIQSPAPEPLAPAAKVEMPKVETKPAEPTETPSPAAQVAPAQTPTPTSTPPPRSVPVAAAPRVETRAIETKTREVLRELPALPAPAPAVTPVAVPKIESAVVPPPIESRPREVPVVTTPMEAVTPPKIERTVTPIAPPALPASVAPAVTQAVAPAPTTAPVSPATPMATTPAATATPSLERSAPTAAARTSAPASAPAQTAGTTDQGNKPQADKNGTPTAATTPGATASGAGNAVVTPPGFSLDNLRDQARDLGRAQARQGSSTAGRSGLFQLQSPPEFEEHKSDLAKALEKAATPDCRDKYAGMGLAAVVPLAAHALGGKGCKW